jgi:peroxiredoxin
MTRKFYFATLFYTGFVVAVGCGDAEKRAAAPAETKPPLGRELGAERQGEISTAAKPRDEVEVDAKPPLARELGAERQAADAAKPKAAIQDPEVKPAAAEEPAKEGDPQQRTAFFRLDANAPAVMPKVVLSKSHEALCKVKVGDVLPAIELPVVGSNDKKKLAEFYGKAATVVVFWKGDRRMTRELLADLGPDVLELFGKQGVAVVGVAVNETAASAKAALDKAGAKFVNWLDADGKAFARVGSVRLPRVYLIDPTGNILWFDIEYSQTTRRELHQALRAVTGEASAPAPAAAKPRE